MKTKLNNQILHKQFAKTESNNKDWLTTLESKGRGSGLLTKPNYAKIYIFISNSNQNLLTGEKSCFYLQPRLLHSLSSLTKIYYKN